MSDFTVSYPRPDDVDRYRNALGLAREAIVRDIVRIVSIGQMAHTGELNDEWVLAGSMGLRLRGSTRFTMMDTDTWLPFGAGMSTSVHLWAKVTQTPRR